MTTATTTTPYRPMGNPKWKKGGPSPNPSGKPRGVFTRYQKFQARMTESGLSPLEFLLAIVRRDPVALRAINVPIEEVTTDLRRACAIDLLPYCHQRLPQQLAMAIDGHVTVMQQALSLLSDEELQPVIKVVERARELQECLTVNEAGEVVGDD
jgi:hypothetical protein